MKLLISLIISMTFLLKCNAQDIKFYSEGTILYERKINLFNLYSSQPDLVKELKKNTLQFKREIFQLDFNSNFSLYKAADKLPENNQFSKIPFDDNIVFSDFEKKQRISEKGVDDKKYLISDSLKKCTWKLTDEKRSIAGFECRRANGVLFDSLYVVVFYCEEIPVKGGPESFSGLPGMILGVALPQLHVTWFATRILFKEMKINAFASESSVTLKPKEFKQMIISDIIKNPTELFKWYFIFSEI